MLVSRDEQSCLVVSYKEVKGCIESAFGYGASTIRIMLTLIPPSSDLARGSSAR
jgi:PAB-dependent poly(A)-specific ribonuclease subunit 3